MTRALEVLLVLLREAARALLFPLAMLAFLPRARQWRRRAERALRDDPVPLDALAGFLARHPPPARAPAHLFLSAGEASGLRHAAALVDALAARRAAIRWSAFGGDALASRGARLLYPLAEHAVMGVAGVLRELPRIVRAFATYLRLLDEDRPDLVLLVDYPGLHVVMARAARRRGIPVLHYIAPQYWAAMPWRVHRYRRSFAATLSILPFESRWFADAGVPAEYVGHPLAGALPPPAEPRTTPAPRLVLMPGSRRAEIRAHLPGMIAVAQQLQQRIAGLEVAVAHADPAREPLLRALLPPAARISVRIGPLATLLADAELAIVKSGTGSLEVALLGVPNVVVYRVRGRLMQWIGDRFLTVPHIGMANLIAGRRIVPEHRFATDRGWQSVATDALALLGSPAARAEQRRDLAAVRARLAGSGHRRSAADWVAAFLVRA